MKNLAAKYRRNLLEDVVPFWLEHSPDIDHGGYFTCLDHQGKVFDTDKFIWLQCRQVWTFSMLYNMVEQRKDWLDHALLGAEFLRKHGRDECGNWYFSLTREGRPLTQPYNIFSDCFAAMAFAQLGKATGNGDDLDMAAGTFKNILSRREQPKGIYEKAFPGTRPSKSLALPMILSNLVLEVQDIIEPKLVQEIVDFTIQEVMDCFFDPDTGLIMEHVSKDGSLLDTLEGRIVNPGHGLESMWFMMDLADQIGDRALLEKAVDIAINLLEYGWDKKFDGIFYMMDVKGHPPDHLEWDQKLWWVHQEAILAMLKGYAYCADARCWVWFERLQSYAWGHFADPRDGEWFGYLNRQGEVLLHLKGGKWKGCFHTPRFLYQGWKTLEKIKHSDL